MSKRTELPNGTVIVKGDDGTWVIKSWVSTELSDKEGQTISISELVKDAPNMMKDNPMVYLGHKDTPLGPITDVQKKMRNIDGTPIPAMKATWELPGNRRYKKWVQSELEKGSYPEVSIKAFAFGEKEFRKDGEGKLSEYPSDFEWTGFALCKSGMNRHVGHIMINGEEIAKSDDDALTNNPRFKVMMQKLMEEDELPYTKALEACKELYSDDISKAIIEKECEGGRDGNPKTEEERKKTHKEKYGTDKVPPKGTDNKKTNEGDTDMPDDIEAIKKKLEDLEKSSQDELASLNKNIESLTKENEGLKADLEKSREPEVPPEPEPVKKEEPEAPVKEPEEIKKEAMKEIMKELLDDDKLFDELAKARGLVKVEGATPKPSELFKQDLNEEELVAMGKMIAKANNAVTNLEIEHVADYEELEKMANGGE